MWIFVFAFVGAFLSILGAGLLLFYRDAAARRLSQIVLSHREASVLRAMASDTPSLKLEKLVYQFRRVLPRSGREESALQTLLTQAGLREAKYSSIFYGAKVLVPAALCLLATVTGLFRMSPLFVYTAACGLGFLAPDLWLTSRIAARQLEIRLGLPDALDLLVICVEAGLSLDKATLRTAEELRLSQPAIADELGLVNLEQRAGRPRADAWNRCAERTGVDTVRALAALLIQAEKFGTSVGKALRAYSDTLRTRRRQEAEERAATTTVKLVFPLVLFIFPSLFVVTLGPSMIIMFEAFEQYFV
ncbi:MAG TPA: type II secretion system F family protein [Bryobacteraceae bacterium]|nr:type II secretion system F family protein [Bryobacteraceae bacterium]